MNQQLFRKNLSNQSSHYENVTRFWKISPNVTLNYIDYTVDFVISEGDKEFSKYFTLSTGNSKCELQIRITENLIGSSHSSFWL